MNWLNSLTGSRQRISELDATIVALTSERDTAVSALKSERESNTSALQALKDDHAALSKANEDLTKERDEALAASDKVKSDAAKATSDFEAKVKLAGAKEAQNQIAASGIPPVMKLDEKAGASSGSSVKTISEFNQLSPSARLEFAKSGGKIVG